MSLNNHMGRGVTANVQPVVVTLRNPESEVVIRLRILTVKDSIIVRSQNISDSVSIEWSFGYPTFTDRLIMGPTVLSDLFFDGTQDLHRLGFLSLNNNAA